MKPKLLDLFCGAGGASMGYHRAGFAVYGIDNKPQPHYPFPFLQMDALEAMDRLLRGEGLTFNNGETLYLADFAVFHASPPCQKWSTGTAIHGYKHPDLLTPIRERLIATGKNYIIENVKGAPLQNAFMLCGTMFGLKVKRHRYFECSFDIYFAPATCACRGKAGFTNSKSGFSSFANKAKLISVAGHNFSVTDAMIAMNIDWMKQAGLTQAIPPVYTEYIGKYLMPTLAHLSIMERGEKWYAKGAVRNAPKERVGIAFTAS